MSATAFPVKTKENADMELDTKKFYIVYKFWWEFPYLKMLKGKIIDNIAKHIWKRVIITVRESSTILQ